MGSRIAFRWDRFSFAITDFYGFSDFPRAVQSHLCEWKVDPATRRPVDVLGQPLDPSDPARTLARGSGRRQYFDVFCSASGGRPAGSLPELAGDCALAAFNSREPLTAATGYFQDRLLPFATGVHHGRSASGGCWRGSPAATRARLRSRCGSPPSTGGHGRRGFPSPRPRRETTSA